LNYKFLIMKTFLSLPTDNDFFNRYANLVPTLYKVGFLSQIVSGVTECGIIYSVAFTSLKSLNFYVALFLSILACFVGVGFIELGLRKFVPYSIRVFIYKRFKGLDLAMTIFILITTIGLLGVSGHLSFKNSTIIVENYTPEVQEQNTQGVKNEYNNERTKILNNYRTDSSSTANGYIQQIKAKKAEYQSLIDVEKRGVERYERQEQRTGKSFRTKKILIKTEIERLEAVRDEKKSVLLQIKKEKIKRNPKFNCMV